MAAFLSVISPLKPGKSGKATRTKNLSFYSTAKLILLTIASAILFLIILLAVLDIKN